MHPNVVTFLCASLGPRPSILNPLQVKTKPIVHIFKHPKYEVASFKNSTLNPLPSLLCRFTTQCGSPLCRFTTLSVHHSVGSLLCRFTTLSVHHSVGSPLCRFTTLSVYHSVGSPLCRFTTLSVHYSVGSPLCRFTTLSVHHSVGSLLCRFTTLSVHHSVALHCDSSRLSCVSAHVNEYHGTLAVIIKIIIIKEQYCGNLLACTSRYQVCLL